jgi:hypothetical protein
MPLEQVIQAIINDYWTTIWLGFVSLIITGFIMLLVKNFIADLANYFKVRTSDLGYGAMILWEGKLKRVVEIRFKEIKVIDDEEICFIPILIWIASIKTYPQPRDDQFKEDSWKHYDGKIERREKTNPKKRVDVRNGFGSNK